MNRRYLYILVFVFATGIYLNTLPNQYAYDDYSVIEGNRFTKEGFKGIIGHITNDSFTGFTGQQDLFHGGRYRPLTPVTFSIEYQFFGENPFISHLVNVILYGMICMIMLKVLFLLFNEKREFKKMADYSLSIPFIATLLFAAHPIHTEVTANIKGRDELMAMLFGLLSWHHVIHFTDTGRFRQILPASIFFFLALMSKESAAPFLIMIPVSVYCFRGRETFRSTWKHVVFGLLSGFFIFILARMAVTGWNTHPPAEENILSNSFMHADGLSERYGTTFYTLWLYIRLLLFPHPLTIDYYPYYIPYIGLKDIRAVLPLILYISLASAAIYYTYLKNAAGYGMLFFLVALFPVSNIPLIIGPFMAERFLFIPSAGFVLSFAWLIAEGSKKPRAGRYIPFIIIPLLVLYSLKTISRNRDWKDNFTLYTTDALTSVNSAIITRQAGHELLLKAEAAEDEKGKREFAGKAVCYLEQAVRLNKSTTETYLLGNSYYANGEYEKALEMYLETLKLNPKYEKAYSNILAAVKRLETPENKIAWYDSLIATSGDRSEPYHEKGLVFGKEMNLPDSSVSNLLRASGLDSLDADCISDLGVAYAMKGDFIHSVFYLEKALRLDPGNEKARRNMEASRFYLEKK